VPVRLIALVVVFGAWAAARASTQAPAPASFAATIARLSEPGGDFGGDNLISNEQSYLHVLPALDQAHVTGGAYLGVGPDQNFSYIAAIKPDVAFILDIRRDNLLLHLLFKAIFALAPTRVEYLSLLTGRPIPAAAASWRDATVDKVIAYIDGANPLPETAQQQLKLRLEAAIKRSGVPLSAVDLSTIDLWHRAFVSAGLSLVFQARGQPPRSYYPSFRDLLRETDRAGRQRGFLATDEAYQVVRALESRDLVIPVVGDVSGPHAMAAIAAEIAARGERLSAFYISNVEFYLYRDGTFPAFAENLKRLPRNERSTMIRSVFPGGYMGRLPQSVPGSYSTSLTQPLGAMLADLAAGRYRSYYDLVAASAR
jgi:hypothetical protein